MFSKTLLQNLPIYLYLKKISKFYKWKAKKTSKHKSPKFISTEVEIYFNSWNKFALLTVNRQKL